MMTVSVLIIIFCLTFLYSFKPDSSLEQQVVSKEQITFWSYSEELIKQANQFEKENPHMKVITKLVNNPETLLEEIYAAVSAGNPPDIAEIPSWYGIYPLIDDGAIYPVTEFLHKDYKLDLTEAIAKRFQYNDELWAIPISYEVPVLFIHETMIPKMENSSISQITLSEITVDAQKEFSKMKWAVNADDNYPWYLINLNNRNEPDTTTAEELVESNRSFLFLQNHLALTEFVNGEGGVLMSSSSKLQLVEQQIGNKFKWKIASFPVENNKIIPNGNGLVAFKKDKESLNNTKLFLTFMQDEERLESIAVASSTIPANKKIIESNSYQNYYRHFPDYQKVILTTLESEGKMMSSRDEMEWKQMIESNENRE